MGISFDRSTCQAYEKAIASEWLITNGLGGYASGTLAGPNTRKYHGLLVVAAKPPVQRYVVLSRVEDRVTIGGISPSDEDIAGVGAGGLAPHEGGTPGSQVFDLSTNEFSDVVHPQGYKYLIGFDLAGPGGGPVWRFQCGEPGGPVIEKSITLVHGQDAVIVRYVLLPGDSPAAKGQVPVKLQLQPMLAGRDFHGTIQLYERPWWTISSKTGPVNSDNPIVLSAPECPVPVHISHNADRFHVSACWWYNFTFRLERERGYPDREDLWTPGILEFHLQPGEPVGFIASTRGVSWSRQEELLAEAGTRRQRLAHGFAAVDAKDEFLSQLAVAADQFIVYRSAGEARPAIASAATSAAAITAPSTAAASGAGASVIAGYPWFEDWGRDAFISMAGLTLVTGLHDVARTILATFADHMRRGLLPNRFPDKSFTPDYNTVDASLWFVHAAYQYWRYTGDAAFLVKYLYPKLCEVMECYRDGTDFGIRSTPDGLIRAGDGNHQPTWMDAKMGDWVVTPRHGKPVEINALWYSNLRAMALLAGQAKDAMRAKSFAALADRVQAVFEKTYWNAGANCLYDVVADDGTPDGSVRPNQLMAVSLPFSPLSASAQKAVVAACRDKLLTPMGMRTLAADMQGYHGYCTGDQRARDMAYHQGTVWPWLLGPFITAYVKTGAGGAKVREEAREFLAPFRSYMQSAGVYGLGSICEIADGNSPHTPRGCPAQAWSVGEVLRSYYEDVLGRGPKWPHEMVAAKAVAV